MRKAPAITFLGAAGTVTGSKYLLEANGSRVLVDCGLFQGRKPIRQRNWKVPPVDPAKLDAVLLTHAHLDHSGYLPVMRRMGFTGPVYCTSGTHALAGILLPDSGHLQEEDARYVNRKGYSKHKPALPLYTQDEAIACLEMLRTVPFNEQIYIAEGIQAIFHPAGHILGASWVQFQFGSMRVTFSGDLGRPHDVLMQPPAALLPTDYLIVESTYGNRRHAAQSPLYQLNSVVLQTIERDGILLSPAFAVGRAQGMLHLIATLKAESKIPDVPVFLNSPMAVNATEIFCAHPDEHRLSNAACKDMCNVAIYLNSAEESKALNRRSGPMIVISASGMATGGRVVHHLKSWLPDARNTVLFAGYQAAGTRGASLLKGAQSVGIHGHPIVVKAQIAEISGLSAHADSDELVSWITRPGRQPKKVYITHGEPEAAAALRDRLVDNDGLSVRVPIHGARHELT